jgi:hypothetical protein
LAGDDGADVREITQRMSHAGIGCGSGLASDRNSLNVQMTFNRLRIRAMDLQKLIADNQQQLELWFNLAKVKMILEVLFLIAVPTILFLVWRELAKANEHKRIDRVLNEARNPFAKG